MSGYHTRTKKESKFLFLCVEGGGGPNTNFHGFLINTYVFEKS